MRGVSFWSFIGPAVSDLNICAPPTPSSGRMATTSTEPIIRGKYTRASTSRHSTASDRFFQTRK